MKDTKVLVWYVKLDKQQPAKVKLLHDFLADHAVILHTEIQETTMIYSEDPVIAKELRTFMEEHFEEFAPRPLSKFTLPHTEPKVAVQPLETEIH